MRKVIFIFLLFCSLATFTQSARMLYYLGLGSYSQRISVWPLVTTLAERGHHVTFATPTRPKDAHKHPKVHEFTPKGFEIVSDEMFNSSELLEGRVKSGRFHQMMGDKRIDEFGLEVCKEFVTNPETKAWIETAKYDLVIIDGLVNECAYGLAHKFKAKTIIFGTSMLFSWWYDPFGIPTESSWISDPMISFPSPMTFFQRVLVTILVPLFYYQKVWQFYPNLDELLRTELNIPEMPSVKELERKTDLMFVNSHFSEEFARSHPPFVVNVGGLHIIDGKNNTQKIPADMAKFISESGEGGFIYVSFGSLAKISSAPQEVRNAFINAFKQTKNTKFILKWNVERPSDMPANVFTADWIPQQLLLSHPKIKAFVTHGGLMGLTEAVHYGVPVIMFPIFAEQDYNAFIYEAAGRGIRLEIATVTDSELSNAFNKIITNPKYKANMLKTMRLNRDRPMTAVETAVWWTEYVLRNDDLSALKPLSMQQTWYERRLLDVWAFVALLLFALIFIPLYILKKLLAYIFLKNTSVKSKLKSS